MILLGAGHDVRPDSFAVSLSPTVGSGTQWSGVLCHHLREGESTRDQADSFGGSGTVAAATVECCDPKEGQEGHCLILGVSRWDSSPAVHGTSGGTDNRVV